VTTTVSLNYLGVARSYLLSRPATTSTTKLPVLIELHGCCATPQQEEDRSGFLDVTGPAIVVYPAGIDESWNAGSCCHGAQAHGVDDVGFITTVVGQVLATQPDAAANRVYLAGYSNGGKMALRMACEAPTLFAAVASYGAVNAKPCTNPAAVSLLELAATGDPELTIGPGGTPKVENGYTEPTVVAQVEQYRQADACNDVTTTATQGTLTTTTWTECASGRLVQLGLYQGGDHGWPTGDGATASAEQVMWNFFQSQSTPS
jgi:polyhydroxybutyrate depolymerase